MALRCISPYSAGRGEDAVTYAVGDIIDATPQREKALLLDSPGSFEVVTDDAAPKYEPKSGPADVLVTKAEPVTVADTVIADVVEAPVVVTKKGKRK